MLYRWEHFSEDYYDEGASLCVWFQEITMKLLSSFIRLMFFQREHPDVNVYISTFLADHGFTGFRKGFYYLCTALDMCIKEPERLKRIVQQVYTETAVRCGASDYTAIERALRHYLDTMLSSPDIDPLLKIRFPERPTLKAFISGLCDNRCLPSLRLVYVFLNLCNTYLYIIINKPFFNVQSFKIFLGKILLIGKKSSAHLRIFR